jgi:hypothetical protein
MKKLPTRQELPGKFSFGLEQYIEQKLVEDKTPGSIQILIVVE